MTGGAWIVLSDSQMVMLCPHVNRNRPYTALIFAISPLTIPHVLTPFLISYNRTLEFGPEVSIAFTNLVWFSGK